MAKEFCIDVDSEWGNKLGFTSDKFMGYLFHVGGYITISFIESKVPGQGNLSKLFDRIQELGLGIRVPTPFPLMEHIVKKKGFKMTMVPFAPEHGINELVDVWVKEPTQDSASLRRDKDEL